MTDNTNDTERRVTIATVTLETMAAELQRLAEQMQRALAEVRGQTPTPEKSND